MPVTVCYLGTYEAGYERNRIVMDALRQAGVSVVECHEPVWESRRHKTGTLGSLSSAVRLGWDFARGYVRLARRYLTEAPDHDVVIIGYLGHLDVVMLAPFVWLRGRPLVFDAFISLYDTLVCDRALLPEGTVQAGAIALLDRASCALAARVLLDTNAHIAYFTSRFGVATSKCRRVLVGADTEVFQPRAGTRAAGEGFTVLHYSKFAPLHGIDTILEAARRLRGERDIRFVLVGGGQLEQSVRQRIEELELDHVELHPWMEPAQLREVIAGAGACLGVFGASEKAARVIPNKLYQYMAVGAPIITRDGAGPRELLRDGEHVLLCPPADPESLARAIVRLRDDPALRERLARNARALFIERCSPLVIGRELAADLEQVVGSSTVHARAPRAY